MKCACVYLSHLELALPGVDARLKDFLEGGEGHALRHDNVVIQQLRCFIRALQDISACVLVVQHFNLNYHPFCLHLVQGLRGKSSNIYANVQTLPVKVSKVDLKLKCESLNAYFPYYLI